MRGFEEFHEPLVRYRAVMDDGPAEFLKALKEAVRKTVIQSPSVRNRSPACGVGAA